MHYCFIKMHKCIVLHIRKYGKPLKKYNVVKTKYKISDAVDSAVM